MHWITSVIFVSLVTTIQSAYNPISPGTVIISTTTNILVLQPKEYGGNDQVNTVFTALSNMTIISSIFDPSARNLYVLYTNGTNGTVYLSQLAALEQLSSEVYQLSLTFDAANINQLNSFSSDVDNRRAFLTDETGVVTLFSMSGLLQTYISPPANLSGPIRSVAYTNVLSRLFVITDTTVDACVNLDVNNLQCCEASPRGTNFRSIAFDQIGGDLNVYVLDRTSGIYQVVLDANNCPNILRPINTLGSTTNVNLQFVIDNGLYFASGSVTNEQDNSALFVANGTNSARKIQIGAKIVALHISVPNIQSSVPDDNTCFHGLSYSTYRAAVILAAIFGTIMGIFMCFNALFCIDFFMTKRIIRSLKQQIPHNLLEDRWNKLIEEKYVKIALERQRKKDDPPARRKSSISGRKTSAAATASNTDSRSASGATNDSLQVPKTLPKITDFLRRKSEGYSNRRRSDEYRHQRNESSEQFTDIRTYPARQQLTTTQANIEPLHEETENSQALRSNSSRRELLRDADFL